MAKIIHTVITEDERIETTDDIFVFTTKNYIGVWNRDTQEYNIMKKEICLYSCSDSEFICMGDESVTLSEFYEQVRNVTNEELEEVYDIHTKVKIAIDEIKQ